MHGDPLVALPAALIELVQRREIQPAQGVVLVDVVHMPLPVVLLPELSSAGGAYVDHAQFVVDEHTVLIRGIDLRGGGAYGESRTNSGTTHSAGKRVALHGGTQLLAHWTSWSQNRMLWLCHAHNGFHFEVKEGIVVGIGLLWSPRGSIPIVLLLLLLPFVIFAIQQVINGIAWRRVLYL